MEIILVVVINDISEVLLLFLQAESETIMELQQAFWNEEDNFETSEKNLYILNRYYAGHLIALLMRLDSENLNRTDLFAKYYYDKIKECLGCEKISFDKILSYYYQYGNYNGGVENMQIECNFEVEPEEVNCYVCNCENISQTNCILINQYLNLNYCKLKDGTSC